MTQYEMTESLSKKCDVTLEEARSALEAGDWNTLTATHLLEQEQFRRMRELNEFAEGGEAAAVQAAPEAEAAEAEAAEAEAPEAPTVEGVRPERVEKARRCHGQGFKNLGEHLRRLVACGNRNRFAVRKGGESLLEMPVTALAVLLLCAFWVCVPLLVIGLFAGCRYSFAGKELGRDDVNGVLGKAADAADRVKQAARA